MNAMPAPLCANDERLADVLDYHDRTQGVVLVVGSAISQFSPTNLATGLQVTKALADALVPTSSVARRMVTAAPFEALIERYPRHRTRECQDLLKRIYAEAPPNQTHRWITDAMRRNMIRHVITPNYDLGIEKADAGHYHRIVEHGDYAAWDRRSPVLFKIHGSADSSAPLVIALSHECVLPSWKVDLLRELLQERTVVVSGYSGLDFEISPALASLANCCRRIVWNGFTADAGGVFEPELNARRVLESFNSKTIVTGDLCECLPRLFGTSKLLPAVHSAHDPPRRNPARDLLQSLSAVDRALWQVAVLVDVGAPVAAAEALAGLGVDDGKTAQQLQSIRRWDAPIHFQLGKYRRARELYLELAATALRLGSEPDHTRDRLQGLRGAADCDRATMSLLRGLLAWRRAQRAALSIPQEELRREQFVRTELQFVELVERPAAIVCRAPFGATVRRRLKRSLDRVTHYAATTGEWYLLQKAARAAGRLDIEISPTSGYALALPVHEGFQHLGTAQLAMLALRESGLAATPNLLERQADLARDIGAWPEVLKLSIVGIGSVPDPSDRRAWSERARQALRECEYPLRLRVLFWLVAVDPGGRGSLARLFAPV